MIIKNIHLSVFLNYSKWPKYLKYGLLWNTFNSLPIAIINNVGIFQTERVYKGSNNINGKINTFFDLLRIFLQPITYKL